MTLLEIWVRMPGATALGWTLLHSLWQGAAIAFVLMAALWRMRSARLRYAAACLAMSGILASFCVTLTYLSRQEPNQISVRAGTVLTPTNTALAYWRRANDTLEQQSGANALPWIAGCWIAGVLIFHLWGLARWMAARRLRQTGVCCAPDLWQKRLGELSVRVRVSRPLVLLESCVAEVPVVIGHVRPVILIPIGLLTGMSVAQIELILLHELAHIRRYDYLVNLVQTSLEALFFYHPMVWWISGIIRTEREHCCDDLVVAMTGNAHEYAETLAALEQNRWAAREVVLAATGGSLMKRIRRLLNQPENIPAAWTPAFSAGLLTLTAAAALAAWQAKPVTDVRVPVPAAIRAAAPNLGLKSPARLLAQVRRPGASQDASQKPSPYDNWLNEDVVYIISGEERTAFNQLQSDKERIAFIEQFWLRRDPTPDTIANEYKEEHYRRIGYANELFGTPTIPGWKSDRGRSYIVSGPPDEIESHPSRGKYVRTPAEGGGEILTYPFQKWRYRYIDGVGDDVRLEFVDKAGSGEYRMATNPREKEIAQ